MSRNDKMKFIRLIEGSDLCITDALSMPSSQLYCQKLSLVRNSDDVITHFDCSDVEESETLKCLTQSLNLGKYS